MMLQAQQKALAEAQQLAEQPAAAIAKEAPAGPAKTWEEELGLDFRELATATGGVVDAGLEPGAIPLTEEDAAILQGSAAELRAQQDAAARAIQCAHRQKAARAEVARRRADLENEAQVAKNKRRQEALELERVIAAREKMEREHAQVLWAAPPPPSLWVWCVWGQGCP